MRRIIALLLAIALVLAGCAQNKEKEIDNSTNTKEVFAEKKDNELADEITVLSQEDTESIDTDKDETNLANGDDSSTDSTINEKVPEFYNLGDPQLLQYMEDSIIVDLAGKFASEDYIIENVSAIYYSKEYLEELEYNSKSNIFFGYTLEELDNQFQGTRYIFTLGDNGETIVEPFKEYDDTYDKVLKNVAIGSGVVLICVTVSVVTGGMGVAPVSMVFATSAKTGTVMALSSGMISGVVAGTIEGIQTGDFNEAIKAAALSGSEAFKWGAISGAIVGGASKALALRNPSVAASSAENATTATNSIPNWRESELTALKQYGGKEQVSFLNGVEVPKSTPGATRPDITRMVGNHLEAIEVKNYDLSTLSNRNVLYNELIREVTARAENLPAGSTQRVVLDVTGRGFSKELLDEIMKNISFKLADIYPDIPIDIMGALI